LIETRGMRNARSQLASDEGTKTGRSGVPEGFISKGEALPSGTSSQRGHLGRGRGSRLVEDGRMMGVTYTWVYRMEVRGVIYTQHVAGGVPMWGNPSRGIYAAPAGIPAEEGNHGAKARVTLPVTTAAPQRDRPPAGQ